MSSAAPAPQTEPPPGVDPPRDGEEDEEEGRDGERAAVPAAGGPPLPYVVRPGTLMCEMLRQSAVKAPADLVSEMEDIYE